MALYTASYLRSKKQSLADYQKIRLYSESKRRSTFDIFLCHSYNDREVIEGIFIELSEMGFSVYVDWIVDPQLDRANVTEESARHIRERLESSRSLLLAISENAVLSKWAPWELGVVDGNTKNCALFPISESQHPSSSFKGREYLSIYPYITRVNELHSTKLYAAKNANTYRPFNEWVAGQKPIFYSRSIF